MPDANAGRRPAGELEAGVLAALWAAGGRPLTPGDVQRDLDTALGASLARTTVTTILARLHEKGSVSRTRYGRGYAYLPVQDSPGLAARRMRTELDKSARDDRGVVLARFVSELGPDDEALLRSLLASGADMEAAAAEGAAGPPGAYAAAAGEPARDPAPGPAPGAGSDLPSGRAAGSASASASGSGSGSGLTTGSVPGLATGPASDLATGPVSARASGSDTATGSATGPVPGSDEGAASRGGTGGAGVGRARRGGGA